MSVNMMTGAGSGPPPMVDPNATTTPQSGAAPPAWLQPILSQYGGGGYQYTPEDLAAIANYMMQSQMDLSFGQMQYQDDYLKQKGRELDLNGQQLDQMKREFDFRSGPYWDWFKNDAFQFEKDKLGMEKQLSANQLAQSGNQTLATQYNTEAAKAQAAAAQWQAMQAMGLGGVVQYNQAYGRMPFTF